MHRTDYTAAVIGCNHGDLIVYDNYGSCPLNQYRIVTECKKGVVSIFKKDAETLSRSISNRADLPFEQVHAQVCEFLTNLANVRGYRHVAVNIHKDYDNDFSRFSFVPLSKEKRPVTIFTGISFEKAYMSDDALFIPVFFTIDTMGDFEPVSIRYDDSIVIEKDEEGNYDFALWNNRTAGIPYEFLGVQRGSLMEAIDGCFNSPSEWTCMTSAFTHKASETPYRLPLYRGQLATLQDSITRLVDNPDASLANFLKSFPA